MTSDGSEPRPDEVIEMIQLCQPVSESELATKLGTDEQAIGRAIAQSGHSPRVVLDEDNRTPLLKLRGDAL